MKHEFSTGIYENFIKFLNKISAYVVYCGGIYRQKDRI